MLQKGERDLLRGESRQSELKSGEARHGERSLQGRDTEEERGRHSFFSPVSQMDRMFDEFFRRRFMSMFSPQSREQEMEELYLPVDIYDDGESVVVKAEVPGMRKEDIDVQLTPDSITISGQKSAEQRVDQKDYFRLERSYGSFSRTCRLPVETITDTARATFKDGILEVRILKSEAATQRVKKLNVE